MTIAEWIALAEECGPQTVACNAVTCETAVRAMMMLGSNPAKPLLEAAACWAAINPDSFAINENRFGKFDGA